MELTANEQAVVERLRMSPEDRQAEVETRRQERLDSLTPEQKQAVEDREARIAAMTAPQRRAYLAGQRLAGIARVLRRDAAKGADLTAALAAVDLVNKADVDWLVGEIKKAD
jgi:membrane protein involved in colicin uptake